MRRLADGSSVEFHGLMEHPVQVAGGGLARVGGSQARAAAFQALAEQHLDASYRLAGAILRNWADAEDATHDALVRAWRSWDQLRDHAMFERWFDRIVVNTCRNRLRSPSRQETRDLSDELAVVGRDPMASVGDRDQIGQALARLSADHRIVVALRYYRDLPIEEIAARTGVPVGTANSRLHYAMRQLRQEIDR